MLDYEQGPIRPPSEARSLLVRITRSCPWNRCAFCPVYKGAPYSRRSVDDVLADLDALSAEHGDRPRTVFLQDADPLLVRPDDLLRVVEGVRARFPRVRRVTTYARARTLARRRLTDLIRLRSAGLDRVHCGLESGSDEVLRLVSKGVTRAEQIEGGQKAKAAGFELSEYVMPGLGGHRLTDVHADETASALVAIRPDFIRLRTTAVIPGTPLAALRDAGAFEPSTEAENVAEIGRFLVGLAGLETRLESDHALNLMVELYGDLPEDLDYLISRCDAFLELSVEDRRRFVLARRLGWMGRLREFVEPSIRDRLLPVIEEAARAAGDPDALALRLRERMV